MKLSGAETKEEINQLHFSTWRLPTNGTWEAGSREINSKKEVNGEEEAYVARTEGRLLI